ncbi:hypothetical protein [Marinimicrobium sp. C2-29]|uniref:hypothetical protein n=1 Tax=Marinimicrobium sp. C2-29 TaxID=3139825 RepID=UPI00313A420D
MNEVDPEETKTFRRIFRVIAWGWKWPPLFLGLVFVLSPLLYFVGPENVKVSYSALPTAFLSGCLILVVWYVVCRYIPKRMKSYSNEEKSSDELNRN